MKSIYGWALLALVCATTLVVARNAQQQSNARGAGEAGARAVAPAPLPPVAPGYRQVLPWGPVPEDPATIGPGAGYVVRNKDVFWEIGRVAVNTRGDRLYAFRRS